MKFKKCKFCGQSFMPHATGQKHCTGVCFFRDKTQSQDKQEVIKKSRSQAVFETQAKKKLKKNFDLKWFLWCEKCKETGHDKYDVHHIIYRSEEPDHENLHHLDNLIVLCRPCHDEAHRHKHERRRDIAEIRQLDRLFKKVK